VVGLAQLSMMREGERESARKREWAGGAGGEGVLAVPPRRADSRGTVHKVRRFWYAGC
jgi:hypothetical protein